MLHDALVEHGISCVGATPKRSRGQELRPVEIREWLEAHGGSDGRAWIAIDDRLLPAETGGWFVQPLNFLHVDPRHGLTPAQCDTALRQIRLQQRRGLGSGKRDASHLPSAVCPWLWVDVDGTSETGEATERKRVEANKLVPPIGRPFNWNAPLFDALRRELIVGGASGCDQGSVLLFTAYDATHAGNTNHPLRCELREWLEVSRAIHVSGVATSLDPIYDRGIGGYYRDVIEPVERAALRSEAIEGGACAVEGGMLPPTEIIRLGTGEEVSFGDLLKREAELYDRLGKRLGRAADKQALASYTARLLLQQPPYDNDVLFFDDCKSYLEQVRTACEGLGVACYTVHVTTEQMRDEAAYAAAIHVQAQLGVHVDRYLGRGAFRSVYAAVIMATGEEVAVACEALSDEQQTESAVTQRITSVPPHPHVLGPPSSPNITLHLEADGNVYTVLERMERELFDVLEGGALIEEDARDYFVQAISGVRFMHQNGVGHRDIKLENMMLTPDGRLKLIDFGLAHIAPVPHTPDTPWSMMNSKTVGTRSYVAPEVGGPFAYDVRLYDVWSLGCTLFALSAGFFIVDRAVPTDPRFQRMQQAQAAGESTVRAIFGLYNRPCHLSDSLVRLLDGMFAIDPARRFTTDDVIASEWMVEQYAPHLALEQSYHTTWLAQPALPQGAVYRSLSGMSDDERPVWRSAGGAAASAVLGGASDGISREALPLKPPPVSRQRAQLNIAH